MTASPRAGSGSPGDQSSDHVFFDIPISSMSPAPKTYDIVIYGATGFTGQLCIRYLSSVAQRQGTQWAIAGRNKQKLEKALEDADVKDIDILVADSTDEDSLTGMAKATKLIISLVSKRPG